MRMLGEILKEIRSEGEKRMNIDRIVMAFAGTVITLSLVLGASVHPYWLFLTAFVGLNMLQAAFTGFCPLAIVLKKLGARTGSAFR